MSRRCRGSPAALLVAVAALSLPSVLSFAPLRAPCRLPSLRAEGADGGAEGPLYDLSGPMYDRLEDLGVDAEELRDSAAAIAAGDGVDPLEAAAAAAAEAEAAEAEGSIVAGMVVDANEMRRRYYEEFFKARHLRGAVASATPTRATPALPEARRQEEEDPAALVPGSFQTALVDLPRGSWFAEAEVRHGRVSLAAFALSLPHWASLSQADSLTSWVQAPPPPLLMSEVVQGHELHWQSLALGLMLVTAVVGEAAVAFPDRASLLRAAEESVSRPVQKWISEAGSTFQPFRSRLKTSELLHGRLAMLGWVPIFVKYVAVYGSPPVNM